MTGFKQSRAAPYLLWMLNTRRKGHRRQSIHVGMNEPATYGVYINT